MNTLKILIVGHGFVGQAVDYGFSHPSVEKTIVDPKYGTSLDGLDISSFDFAFVCVPTPMGADGSIDSSILLSVYQKLRTPPKPFFSNWPVVIIKSTVTPDILEQLDDGNVVYNPEFLTEKSANEQFVNPQFHIIGGSQAAAKLVETLYTSYSLCNPCPTFLMTMKEASFVKYTINSFLAMKVAFFNQIYDAVSDTDANFATIIKAVGSDSRIGHSHTKVPGFDGKQGFGGACFPKDTSAFTQYSKRLTLLEECIKVNNEYRSKYNRDEREVSQNVNYGQTKEEQ